MPPQNHTPFLRRTARSCLRSLGWEMTRYRKDGNVGRFLENLSRRNFTPKLIADVGANRGLWTRMALRYFPSAQFVLLEPQESMRPHLDQLCRETPNVRWLNAAAGENAGTSSLNIYNDPTHSSLLAKARLAADDDNPVSTQTVRLLPLREACGGVPDLVKVDTEGYELHVLKGCASLMGHTEIFLLELALTPIWDGSASLTEVVRHMAAHGYQVFDIVDKVSTRADGFTRQVDVAFCRDNSRFLQPA